LGEPYLLDFGDDPSSEARFDSMGLHQTQGGVGPQITLAHPRLLKEEAQLGSSSLRCV